MYWEFQKHDPKAIKRDPIEAEFFIGEASGEKDTGKTDTLVRETIQNSLDARLDQNEPVKIKFSIHRGGTSLPKESGGKYFASLQRHLDAVEMIDFSPSSAGIEYLVIEDYNTTGLTGKTDLCSDPSPTDQSEYPEAFYWFWRNIGRSGKTADTLGRWGLGKTVLPASSRFSSFFGLTKRVEDDEKYLMGLSILKIHKVEGQDYSPEGFFCDRDASDYLQMPYCDGKVLNTFQKNFKLDREKPGLSIVVPSPLPEITGLRILRSVIFNFHVRILKSELIIKIEDGNTVFEVSRDTIAVMEKKVDWSELPIAARRKKPKLDFIKEALATSPKELPPAGPANIGATWTMDTIGGENACAEIYDSLEQGDLVRLRVPLNLNHKKKGSLPVHFDLALRWDKNASEGFECAVREGMTISKVDSGIRKKTVSALILVENKALSDFLCDAEGPAHTEWKSSEKRPAKSYTSWVSRLSFISKSPIRCWELLQPNLEDDDKVLLKDFFPIVRPGKPLPRKQKGRGNQNPTIPDEPPEPPDLPPPKPKNFRIEGGSPGELVVRAEPRFAGRCNLIIKVKIVAAGKATWSAFDFDFGDSDSAIEFEFENASGLDIADNRIKVNGAISGFFVRASGFDPNLDLTVSLEEH